MTNRCSCCWQKVHRRATTWSQHQINFSCFFNWEAGRGWKSRSRNWSRS